MSNAQLTVTSGPDRGRVFDLAEELVHIGRGDENQVVLRDPTLEDHQASIVCRQGRYAIYTPVGETVDVDGDPLPADQWVWLPDEAKIRIGERTSVVFNSPNGASDPPADPPTPKPMPKAQAGTVDPFADDDDEPADDPAPARATPPPKGKKRPSQPKRRRRKRGEKGEKPAEKRQVARFVTDQSGDTVVTLGEDGQLPELKLREGATAKERRAEKPAEEGTSPLLYVALAFSMLSSVALLFLDFSPGQSTRYEQAKARGELRQFMGSGESRPEPYQQHLRNAVLARQRRDLAAERLAYRRVLSLLNAEDNDEFLGLTGNPDRDKRLRELIGILLNR